MPATADHLDWDTLPETVREILATVSGGAVIERGGTPVVRQLHQELLEEAAAINCQSAVTTAAGTAASGTR